MQTAQHEAALLFHAIEMDLGDGPWEAWLDRVSAMTGIANLDGDNSAAAQAAGTADGYSYDDLYEQFEHGISADAAARAIRPGLAAGRAS